MFLRGICTVVILIGCCAVQGMTTTYYFEAESKLNPDGTFERELRVMSDRDKNSTRSNGTESTIEDIYSSADLAQKLKGKVKPFKFERRYEKLDRLFVLEYEFEEISSSTVRMELHHQLVAEIADEFLPIYREAITTNLKDEFDGSALLIWLDRHLETVWHELAAIFTDATTKVHINDSEAMDKFLTQHELRILDVLKRHGVEVSDREQVLDFSWLEAVENPEQTLIEELLLAFVRTKSGASIAKSDLQRLWKRPIQDVLEENRRRLDDVVNERFETLAMRALGDCFIFCSTVKFNYVLSVPGRVIETTGRILAPNRVVWSFDDTHAFYTGASMRVRSFHADIQAQEALLGRTVFSTHESMFRFVQFVDETDGLLEQLQLARLSNSMSPALALTLAAYLLDRNSPDAWLLYCKAAIAGSSDAMHALARSHQKDRTVSPGQEALFNSVDADDRAAYVWYTLAENAGDSDAKSARKKLTERMSGYEIDVSERLAREWTSNNCPFPW